MSQVKSNDRTAYRFGKVSDIPDECYRVAVSSGSLLINLIELIIKEDEALIIAVCHPALRRVSQLLKN
jgi:hypothetical protein